MRTSPPFSLWLIATLSPDASDSSFSSAVVSASLAARCGAERGPLSFCGRLLRQRFRLADRQAAFDDAPRQPRRIFGSDQRARVAGRERSVDDHVADRVRQLQQAQRIGDMAAALADDLSEIGLRVIVLVEQLLVAERLLDRIEVGALHVLDDGELEGDAVVDVAHDDRNLRQARRAGRHASDARRR